MASRMFARQQRLTMMIAVGALARPALRDQHKMDRLHGLAGKEAKDKVSV
jgi:hypothetical protein